METTLYNLPSGFVVRRDAEHLHPFSPTGGPPLPQPSAVVQPKDTEQIKALVQWANQHQQKLVPVSSAHGPRRHGGSVPSEPALIVDLSQMKRVHHVDGVDAIAVIEPGVTFPEFDAQLANHGLRSYKPLMPRRSKSVIASHLEREPITSPRDQWDAADPMATVEMVFGTGKHFRTGSAAGGGELDEQLKAGLRQMSAPGPYATDFLRVVMGSQGTLGIVSWASVYCERIPARERAFFVGCDRLAPLAELSSRLSWRKLAAQTFIVNNAQLALLLAHDRESILQLAGKLPAWTLFVNISAPNFFPDERIEYETEALHAETRALHLEAVEQLAGQAADRITRMHQALPAQPYKDRLGYEHDAIFFLSQMDKAAAFVKTIDRMHTGSGNTLPYAIYLQPRVQGSSCHLEYTSFWDGSASSAASHRTEHHRTASEALDKQGAYFSRPYGIWKDIAYSRDSTIVPYLRQAKSMFDPCGVLNPGKFC